MAFRAQVASVQNFALATSLVSPMPHFYNPARSRGSVRAQRGSCRARSRRTALRSEYACKDAAILDCARTSTHRAEPGERAGTRSCGSGARRWRFWILDFGFWIRSACLFPQSKIQNLKSKIRAAFAFLLLIVALTARVA